MEKKNIQAVREKINEAERKQIQISFKPEENDVNSMIDRYLDIYEKY